MWDCPEEISRRNMCGCQKRFIGQIVYIYIHILLDDHYTAPRNDPLRQRRGKPNDVYILTKCDELGFCKPGKTTGEQYGMLGDINCHAKQKWQWGTINYHIFLIWWNRYGFPIVISIYEGQYHLGYRITLGLFVRYIHARKVEMMAIVFPLIRAKWWESALLTFDSVHQETKFTGEDHQWIC